MPMPTKQVSLNELDKKGPFLVFLFMLVMAIACFGAAFVLGTEPRMDLVRTGESTFQVTGINSFSGIRFYSKSIQGVTGVQQGDDYRDRRTDSKIEKRKQRKREHLAFAGENGAVLRWDKEGDQRVIEDFMRGNEPSFELRDPTPIWRKAVSWLFVVFGVFVLMGGIGAFFPKRKEATPKAGMP